MVEPGIIYKKEFYQLRHTDPEIQKIKDAYIDYSNLKMPTLGYLQLQGHQLFLQNLFSPKSSYKRLLLYHGTGTGKTMVINALAKIYIDFFKNMKQQPQVTIIGFTEKIIIKDLLKFPELGYIKDSELEELNRLATATSEKEIARRRTLRTTLTKRIVNRSRGGYYKFYGYQAFSQDLIGITAKGVENKISYNYIYEDERILDSRVKELEHNGMVVLNRLLLDSLKYGLIACDEFHLLYNMNGKNNRGMAIKYALDILEREDPSTAPRIVYASATPLTSGPTEIVDIMELLIPNAQYKKKDFFEEGTNKFKPGALDKIGTICRGYVSFLKDTNTKVYPQRYIEGSSVRGLPYLKFIECVMSSYQERTLRKYKKHDPNFETLLASESLTLYDMAFPNPDSDKEGLYTTSDINKSIMAAPASWKKSLGITLDSSNIIQGPILKSENIGKYSSKYKTLLTEITSALKQKLDGKMLIYHYYVAGSGLLLIKNILLENGFVDETSAPLSNTRCSICGKFMKDHQNIDEHRFMPARFLMVYGEMSPQDIDRVINLYDNPGNKEGYEYRLLLGSRVVNEGYDFKEIRYMYILSLPKDISTMIQVFGRAVRRHSHSRLPESERFVKIHILVSAFYSESGLSPELLNYKRKLEVYLQIQEVEKQLRIHAIDNFINYHKMNTNKETTEATLEGLPYTPSIIFDPKNIKIPDYLDTYYRYGYIQQEIKAITIIIKKLFSHQPVWKYDDLERTILNPDMIFGTQYNHTTFDPSSIKISMYLLLHRSDVKLNQMVDMTYNTDIPYIVIANEIRVIVYREPYYILAPIDKLGIPVLDYNQWMLSGEANVSTKIDLNKYIHKTSREKMTETINNILDKYKSDLHMSLVELPIDHHYHILDMIIDGCTNSTCQAMALLYKDIGVLLYKTDFITDDVAKTYGMANISATKPIGYRAGAVAYIGIGEDKIEVPVGVFNTLERPENQKLIGYLKGDGFLLRMPMEHLVIHKDRRKINKGAICSTYTAGQRRAFAQLLDIKERKYADLCEDIKKELLKRELRDRNNAKGFKWFYLPFDVMPYL